MTDLGIPLEELTSFTSATKARPKVSTTIVPLLEYWLEAASAVTRTARGLLHIIVPPHTKGQVDTSQAAERVHNQPFVRLDRHLVLPLFLARGPHDQERIVRETQRYPISVPVSGPPKSEQARHPK